MLETVLSALSRIYSLPCGDVGTPVCAASFSVMCSPIICALVPVFAGFLVIAIMAGATSTLRGLMVKLRYRLARRICRRYAREYLRDVDRMGLAWTLALIDEDVALYGHPFNHALARAGVIDYAERAADLTPRTPSTGLSRCGVF